MRPLRDSLRWLVRSWRSGAVVTVLALSACGGGSGSGDAGGNIVATVTAAPSRIEIAPNAVLLTAPGQTKALKAKVYDSDNREINVAVQWETTRPAQVAVSGDGLLTAAGSGGSSQITARIGDLKSPPLLAVHTQLPAGAVLLTDTNIVGEPEETAPGTVASMNNTYRVQLTGMTAPAVGNLLINTEGKVVGGRVTAVQTINGIHHVTLALVPARELFPQLNIKEVIDLSQAEVTIPAAIQAQYDIRREGNTFTFTPKPGQISLTAKTQRAESRVPVARMASLSEIGEFKLGPFTCKAVIDGAAGAGSLPVALTLPPAFTVALNQRLDIVSTPANGLERFVLHSEPNVTIEAGLKALLAFEGKVTCEGEWLVIKIPVGGPIALVIGGQLPVGVGVELGGKVTLANMGFSVKGTAKTTGDVGLACPPVTGCAIVHEFGPLDTAATPTPDLPSVADFRIEPSLSTYAFIKASIGNPFLQSLRFDAFKVKAGMALKGNFAPQIIQLADPSYQSDYKLVSELKAGVDTGFTGLAGLLGLNAFAETLLEVSLDVANSPTGTVSADKAQYDLNEAMNFKVKLDPAKINFLGLYNVQRVVLVRGFAEVASITASAGQNEFDFNMPAPTNVRASEYTVFLVTALLNTDLLALEVGQAGSPGICVPQTGQDYCYTVLELPDDGSNYSPLGMNARGEVLFGKSYISDSLQGACNYSDTPAQRSCGLVWKAGAIRELPNRFIPVGIADDGTVGGNQLEGTTYYSSNMHPAVALSEGQSSIRLATSVPRSGNDPTANSKLLVTMSAGGRATYVAGDNGYTYSGFDYGYCDMSKRYCLRWVYHESVGPIWGEGREIRRDQLPASGTTFGVAMFDGDAVGRVGQFLPYSSNDYSGMKDFEAGVLGRVNWSIDSLGTVLFQYAQGSPDYRSVFDLDPPSPDAPLGSQPYALGRNGHALFCSAPDALNGTRRVRVVNVHTGEQGPEINQSLSLTQAGHTINASIPCEISKGNWVDPQGRMLAQASSATNPRVRNVIMTPRGQSLP